MSDKSWTERTGLMAGLRRTEPAVAPSPAVPVPAAVPASAGLELVKSDTPAVDPFKDTPDYEAVRPLAVRSANACFIDDGGEMWLRPWSDYHGANITSDGRLLVHYPGLRIEVEGENLASVLPRLMAWRADVWRPFREGYHHAEKGAAVIRHLRAVVLKC